MSIFKHFGVPSLAINAANALLDGHYKLLDNVSEIKLLLAEAATANEVEVDPNDVKSREEINCGWIRVRACDNTGCYKFLDVYRDLKDRAAKVGLNAAAFMPRLVEGDIVGTPRMIEVALGVLAKSVHDREERAGENPKLALQWMIKNIMAYGTKKDKKQLDEMVEKLEHTVDTDTINDVNAQLAIKTLTALGMQDAQKEVYGIVRDFPTMSAKSIIMKLI